MAEAKRNYDKELQALLESLGERTPRLLLHACCAPCSSAVLERLGRHFLISVLYYNPNIAPRAEYDKRLAELRGLLSRLPGENPIQLLPCDYDGAAFEEIARGLEDAPEGGERCKKCFRLRLEKTAELARAGGYDYFGTTLSISPLKNAALLNEIGQELAGIYGVPALPGDFKKRDGYKRSLELSREYGLYRQDYCGCVYSLRETQRKRETGSNGAGENQE